MPIIIDQQNNCYIYSGKSIIKLRLPDNEKDDFIVSLLNRIHKNPLPVFNNKFLLIQKSKTQSVPHFFRPIDFQDITDEPISTTKEPRKSIDMKFD